MGTFTGKEEKNISEKLLWLFNNSVNIVALIGGIFATAIFIAKFIGYLYSIGKFKKLGIDLAYYDWSEGSAIYSGILFIIFYIFLFFMGFLLQKVLNSIKNKELVNTFILLSLFIFLNYIVVLFSINIHFDIKNLFSLNNLTFLIAQFVLLISELFCNRLIRNNTGKKINDKISNNAHKLSECSMLCLYIICICVCIYCLGYSTALLPGKTYFTNNKIILYSTNDYAIVSPYKNDNNKLIINNKIQEKIITADRNVRIEVRNIYSKDLIN